MTDTQYAPNSMEEIPAPTAEDLRAARVKIIRRAIELAGGQSRLAGALRVRGSYVTKWKSGLISPEYFQMVKVYIRQNSGEPTSEADTSYRDAKIANRKANASLVREALRLWGGTQRSLAAHLGVAEPFITWWKGGNISETHLELVQNFIDSRRQPS